MTRTTELQNLWLKTRGGLKEYDVIDRNGELCVGMWSSKKKEFVPIAIPSDKCILKTYRVLYKKPRKVIEKGEEVILPPVAKRLFSICK